MKKLIFAAMATAALAMPSCSSDEVVDLKQDGAINFSVGATNATRGDFAITTNNIKEFKTWAIASFNPNAYFMDGYVVSGGNGNWNYVTDAQPLKFWPNQGTVNFFSVAPETAYGKVSHNPNGTFSFTDYTVVTDASEDLLYAFNLNESKTNPTVKVNFRHALSQILFKVRNINKDLKISIDQVRVCHLNNKATMTWATQTTSPWLEQDPHVESGKNIETERDDTWGEWGETSGEASYVADITNVVNLVGATNQEYIWLSAAKADVADPKYNDFKGLFLMPQTINPWNFKDTSNPANGAYIEIKCKVVDSTGAQLWPTTKDATGEVVIPLTAPSVRVGEGETATTVQKWMQGKRYIYQLTFGKGAGYIPGDDPKPVLVQVDLDVTVDEFQTQTPIDVDMNKKDPNPTVKP